MGSAPEHCSKVNIKISESREVVGFPVPIKVIVKPYYSILSVQLALCLKVLTII